MIGPTMINFIPNSKAAFPSKKGNINAPKPPEPTVIPIALLEWWGKSSLTMEIMAGQIQAIESPTKRYNTVLVKKLSDARAST